MADALTVFVAILPLALVCTARVLAGQTAHRAALPPREAAPPRAETPAARRHLAALAVAAVLAIPAELAATALIKAAGGWQVNPLRTAVAGAGQLAGNARLAGQGLLELFGADVFGAATGPRAALAVIHLAGAAIALAAVPLAARRFFRAPLIESVLLAGILLDVAAYLAGVQATDILSTREIAPVLPFAAVLAGRLFGPRLLSACQVRPSATVPRPGSLRLTPLRPAATARTRATATVPRPGSLRLSPLWPPGTARTRATATRYAALTVLALYLAGLGYAAAKPPAAAQDASLAAWLRAHHLTAGLSGYHQANIVTLDSGGAVTLRPVRAEAGRLAAYTWNANDTWFDPSIAHPAFLVLTRPGAPGSSGLTVGEAIATFGRPGRSYQDGIWVILVWPRVNLLVDLR